MSENKKPEIRFEGYSDNWEQRKLGDIAESFEYGLNAAAKDYDGHNKYIRITDIDDSSHEFLQSDLTSPDTNINQADNYRLRAGDIIFARTGASVGKTYIYKPSDGLVYYAGFLIRAKIMKDYDPEFVFQNTLTDDYYNYIRITSQRSGQPGVNAQEYSDFEIKVPSLPEQKKIGCFLRSLDNLITLHQRKLNTLQDLKKSMLVKMFPKEGETRPEIRFERFTDDWKQYKLGDLGSVAMCKRIFKNQTSENGEIPFYKIGTFGGKADAYISRELFEEYKHLYPYPKSGDILISASGSIGRTVEYSGEDAYFQDSNIVWLKHNNAIENSFLKQLYEIIKWSGIEGSTIKRLYNDNILKTEIMIPSVTEQNAIGQYLNQIDNLITLNHHKLESLLHLKSALLKKMFV